MMRMVIRSRSPTTASNFFQRRWLWITVATALQRNTPAVWAFRPLHYHPPGPNRARILDDTTVGTPAMFFPRPAPYHSGVKLPMSSSKNEEGGGGFLDTLKNAAKAILPKSWFPPSSDNTGRRGQDAELVEREKELQREIKGSLAQILKDAPFPIRALGGAIAPLFSSALSSLAEMAREQQSTVNSVLTQASESLINDPMVIQTYGSDVQMSMQPFSQSTSTSSINGKTTSRIQIATQVYGSLDSGTATLLANEAGLYSIQLQSATTRRTISVNTKRSSTRPFPKTQRNDDIIEAEIIEKNVKKP